MDAEATKIDFFGYLVDSGSEGETALRDENDANERCYDTDEYTPPAAKKRKAPAPKAPKLPQAPQGGGGKKAKKVDAAVVNASPEERQLLALAGTALNERLDEIGVSKAGTKIQKVKRLLKGAVTYVPPPDDDLTYEYDAAKPTSKAIYCCRAPLDGKACVRCIEDIEQGNMKVVFDTHDTVLNTPRDYHYHLECFAKYPPKGVDRFIDLTFCAGSTLPATKSNKLKNASVHDPKLAAVLRAAFNNNAGERKESCEGARGKEDATNRVVKQEQLAGEAP